MMRVVSSRPILQSVRWIAAIGVLVALAGCGDHATHLPAACVGDFGGLMKALAAAPQRVLVDGQPISSCFKRGEGGADLQALGSGLLAAAQQLGDRARNGNEQAALQLGYLVGAARRGAQRSGLADELVRRLEAETSGLGAGHAAYQRGLRAGSRQG
jgi:hypothetical protein